MSLPEKTTDDFRTCAEKKAFLWGKCAAEQAALKEIEAIRQTFVDHLDATSERMQDRASTAHWDARE